MPTNFPSDDIDLMDMSPFLKIIDSPLNLQILFNLTIYVDLSYDDLLKKLGSVDEASLHESLNRMKEMELVEEYIAEDGTHFKASRMNYQTKTFEEYSEFDTEQLRHQLNEEFIYSYRIISLIKSILGKLVHYICDFYINRMQSPQLIPNKIIQELQYDTAVPRLGFVNKEEFDIYRRKFFEFETGLIKELQQRRKALGIEGNPEVEYMIFNLFLPIKKVLEHKS